MLVNIPFIASTEEELKKCKDKLLAVRGEAGEDLEIFDFQNKVPQHCSESFLGFEDSTGLYDCRLRSRSVYYSVDPQFELLSYTTNFPLPVKLVENIPTFYDGEFEKQEDLLWKRYGFTRSVEDFMTLIGNQLKESKRKFAIILSEVEYYDTLFNKNGRIYHTDHSSFDLKEGDKLINFSIYELKEKSEYTVPNEEKMTALAIVIQSEDFKEKIDFLENINNKELTEQKLKDYQL